MEIQNQETKAAVAFLAWGGLVLVVGTSDFRRRRWFVFLDGRKAASPKSGLADKGKELSSRLGLVQY